MILIVLLSSCEKREISDEILAEKIDGLISSEWVDVSGVSVDIYGKDEKLGSFSGYADDERRVKLTENQPFRIASITKTFVAAAVLVLHERGDLSIYHSISTYISKEHIQLLVAEGYEVDKITLLHCLQHTSGIFDYAFGHGKFGRSPYLEIASKDPSRIWSRTDQIQGAMEWGHPYGKPNEAFQYSDTGYILLGEIIENITNLNLGQAIRELIDYDKLGLKNTWYEVFENQRDDELVGRYFRRKDFTPYHASIDLYGGGGIVSTTQDLAIFYFHLFQGNIFQKEETRSLLFSQPKFTSNHSPIKDYRLGFEVLKIYGEEGYFHDGIWNTQVIYLPKKEMAIAINFTYGNSDYLIKHIIKLILGN
ncbi:MAG: serine hydrolase domain-containing protein [Bacteroidota bacterium]